MSDEWTHRARQVAIQAEREAVSRGHAYVRSEHYLFALLEPGEESGAGTGPEAGHLPSMVLGVLDVPVGRLRQRVGEVLTGGLPAVSDVPRLLRTARFEMDLMGAGFLGSEHLLIGVAVEGDGLLDEFGATPDRLREGAYRVLRDYTYGPPPAFGDHAVTVPPALRALDDQLGALRRRRWEAEDDTMAAQLRDEEKQALDRRQALVDEWSGWIDTVRVVREAEYLRAEVRRLNRLLRTHGIEP